MLKKRLLSLALVCCMAGIAFGFATPQLNGDVASREATTVSAEELSENDVVARGLFTDISIDLRVYNQQSVRAVAINNFTLFPAIIATIVKLYSSTTYTEDVSKMNLEAKVLTGDLNMGEKLVAEAPIAGRDLYWCGVVTYSLDGNPSKTAQTETIFVAADGFPDL